MTAAETLTDDMICALAREAAEAGDRSTRYLARKALLGDAEARRLVAEIITDARAQDDESDFVRVVP